MNIIEEMYANCDEVMNDNWDFMLIQIPDFTNVSSSITSLVSDISSLSSQLGGYFKQKTVNNFNVFDIPNTLIEEMTIPVGLPSFSMDKIKDLSSYIKSTSFKNDISMVIRETSSFKILNYFKIWINEFYDLKNKLYRENPNNNRRAGLLLFWGNTYKVGQGYIKTISHGLYFKNLKFVSMSDGLRLSHVSSEPIKYEVNLTCDQVYSYPEDLVYKNIGV